MIPGGDGRGWEGALGPQDLTELTLVSPAGGGGGSRQACPSRSLEPCSSLSSLRSHFWATATANKCPVVRWQVTARPGCAENLSSP